MKNLKNILRDLRESRKLPPEQFAKILGVSKTFMYSVESGEKSMPPAMCNAVIDKFPMSAADTRNLVNRASESCVQVRINLAGISDKDKTKLYRSAMQAERLRQ